MHATVTAVVPSPEPPSAKSLRSLKLMRGFWNNARKLALVKSACSGPAADTSRVATAISLAINTSTEDLTPPRFALIRTGSPTRGSDSTSGISSRGRTRAASPLTPVVGPGCPSRNAG